ncbi:PREDICTED: uncharacterized protein LOC106740676 [Dinoponera quadriceps]|uniref:Uncharacterized protein LOC106740676 n=1 Tax=Dinoponera quadriceps TaxID=609295 RepID=A0A6P3WMU1_DINQU|nr:PREDICTED: uncharacterized protein LOC106740676 [Dinoponera quadriceps]
MSVIESLLNPPLRKASDNVCRFCQKTFCCTKCRNRHVGKVHPNLNADCALCASKTLPMRQFEAEKLLWENKKLLSHIADRHLPLRCVLCENLFETSEDLKSVGACKWHSEHRRALTNEKLLWTPTPTNFEAKLRRIVSDIKYNNSHRSFAQLEIYRNTSTPMFVSQKNGFEYYTPCAPNFSLKTPNSLSIAQSNATSKIQRSQTSNGDIKFFSFSPSAVGDEGRTPFRSSVDEQFPRNNTGRKLNIKESNEIVSDDEAKGVASSYDDYTTSPVDMNLTDVQCNQERTPKQNVGSHEESGRVSDVVKRVRFSDQYETLPPEFGHPVKNSLNTTEDEDVFHDAHDVSGVKDTNTRDTGNAKDVNVTSDTKSSTEDTEEKEKKDIKEKDTKEERKENVEDVKDTRDDQVDNKERSLVQSSKDSSNNTQVDISQENKQNAEKENQAVEALPNLGVSTMTQKGNSRVLMMVLVENNSNSPDLMPLINSGLKKLEEQIASPSPSTSELPNVADTTGYTRRSTTKMEMSVFSVESYSNDNNAEMMADHPQVEPTFPVSSVEDQRSGNGGILSVLTQAVRLAFRNLSGVTSSSTENSEALRQRQIIEDAISLPETGTQCSLGNNTEIRYGKRTRDVNEASSWVGSVSLPDIRSPLPKRKRGWYKIKGRRPIHSADRVTSPRGVSSETQIFSQGSLTVGDTILPLPARAHPEASLTPPE